MTRAHSRSLLLRTLIAAVTVAAVAGVLPSGHPQGRQILSPEAMSRLWGAGACKDCRYIGTRLDECYHDSWTDPCDPDGCIANYCIDNTCDPGTGTCNATKDDTAVGLVQYYRADSGCATNNPSGWTTWITHYYGDSCATLSFQVRCQKSSGSCDGTLIDSSARTPGIVCY